MSNLITLEKIAVSPHKLKCEDLPKQLAKQYKNTGKELSGCEYIGYITYDQALRLNLSIKGFTPNSRDMIDIILYSKSKNKELYDELTKQIPPWRAEWIDLKFSERNGKIYYETNHIINPRTLELTPIISIPLKEIIHLKKDCYVELDSFNEFGLPTKKSKIQEYAQGENIYYLPPVADCVAGFWAYPGRVGLGCNEIPRYSISGLGVRRIQKI